MPGPGRNYIPSTFELEGTDESCQYRAKHRNIIDSIPCCHRLKHTTCFKTALFVILVCLDLIDVGSDWLLYRDVISIQQGLVFGPTEDVLTYSLLVFSILGTLTFIIEITNYWFEIFRSNPKFDIDLLSAITIWLEDVPQIAINVAIVACREEAISYFQLVKASIIIIGAIIRFIIYLIRYCDKKALKDVKCAKVNKESRYHVVYRVFIMIGLIITICGAITVFLFTQSEQSPDGSLDFKTPDTLLEGKYDDAKYFKNVSIYFSHPEFQDKTDSNEVNLIRLLKINEVRNSNTDQTVRMFYKKLTNSSDAHVAILVGTNRIECFTFNYSDPGRVTMVSDCDDIRNNAIGQWIFQFHFKHPSVPSLVFGDIKYNVKAKFANGTCQNTGIIINSEFGSQTDAQVSPVLHYFRKREATPEENHVFENRFYKQADLVDISKVWKTGFTYCKSSGSLAPHFDDSIPVPC